MLPGGAVEPRGHARVLFHLALPTVILFGLGTVVAWTFALVSRALRSGDEEDRRWRHRLFVLALLDTALVVAFATLVVPAELPGLEVAAAGAAPRPLFQPTPGERCLPAAEGLQVPWELVGAAVVAVGLYLWGRRRGMDATPLWVGGLLLGVSALTQAAALGTCFLVGGPSGGGLLVSLYAQTLALVAGAGWLVGRMRRTHPEPEERRPGAVRTFLLGVLYMLSGGVRIGMALLILGVVTGQVAQPYGDSPLHELASSGLSWQAAVAFVLPVALIGPASEELLFRGVILTWLARWLPVWLALAISAVLFGSLHLFYGPFALIIVYYGWVLGWARLHSGGLKAPIALHVAINGTASAALLLAG